MADTFLPIELAFLTAACSSSKNSSQTIDTDDEIGAACVCNDFTRVLLSSTSQSFIKPGKGDCDSLCMALQRRAEEYISSGDVTRKQHVLSTGIAALEMFVQANWTGPPLSDEVLAQVLPQIAHNDDQAAEDSRKQALQELSVNGEPAYVLTAAPELLCIARAMLGISETSAEASTASVGDATASNADTSEDSDATDATKGQASSFVTPLSVQLDASLASTSLWRARTLFVHQALLANPAASLHDAIMQDMNTVVAQLEGAYKVEDLPARVLLEHGRYFTYYNEVYKALNCWQEAQKWLGLEIELSGAMGVRTRFQTKATSQLLLSVRHGHTPIGDAVPEYLPMKKDMNDDTRLEKIDFGRNDKFSEKLSLVEQATVLAMCTNVKNQNPKHGKLSKHCSHSIACKLSTPTWKGTAIDTLYYGCRYPIDAIMYELEQQILAVGITTEEMKPYLDYVISSPHDWLVQTVALWTLARLEATDMRAMTRSVEQMQTLSNHYQDPAPSAAYRMQRCVSTCMSKEGGGPGFSQILPADGLYGRNATSLVPIRDKTRVFRSHI